MCDVDKWRTIISLLEISGYGAAKQADVSTLSVHLTAALLVTGVNAVFSERTRSPATACNHRDASARVELFKFYTKIKAVVLM